jgi:hypothetical protein
MAVEIIKQRVCDLCGSDSEVKTYRVGLVGNGRGVAPDLCVEHAEPLERAMAAVPKTRSSSGLRKAPPVRTEAQVQRMRHKRRKTAS